MSALMQIPRYNTRVMKLRTISASGTDFRNERRPDCLAKERLLRWRPLYSREPAFPNADLEGVKASIAASYEPSTLETYGTGLLAYHEFCGLYNISEDLRAPASPVIISTFLATLVGLYAGSTVENYLYGVRAWHIIHGVPWAVHELEMKTLFKAAHKSAPATSRKKKR